MKSSGFGHKPLIWRRRAATTGLALFSLLLAGVVAGWGNAAIGAPSRAAASTASASSAVAYAKKQLQQYTGIPKFVAPGPSFNARKLSGKHIYVVPQQSSLPFLQGIMTAMTGAAKTVGVNVTDYQSDGSTTGWVQGINQAITQHANLLDLLVTDPRVLVPQLASARSAHIPIVSTHLFATNQSALVPHGIAASTSANLQIPARLMADWAIADTNAHANVLVVMNREVLGTPVMVNAIVSELHAHCPGCSLTELNVPATQWATKIYPEVQSALIRNPKINYVLPIYDSMLEWVVPAIQAAGRAGSVHVATYNGTPFALRMIQNGNIVRMDVGENLQLTGYEELDQDMRVMSGLKPGREHLALRVFTKSNVNQTGKPPTYSRGYGSAFLGDFARLWSKG